MMSLLARSLLFAASLALTGATGIAQAHSQAHAQAHAQAETQPDAESRALPVLEPYKLVRSLRMLQDQVVAGKPEAIVMLNKLLGFVSEDMERAPKEFWDKPENIYAAIIYLFNGGNPDSVRKVLTGLNTDRVPQELVKGALAYASGRTVEVVRLFSVPLSPEVPAELKSSIILVTASQMTAFDPASALLRLDQVRLDAPGTLFEEAAIRRSLPIAARLGDADKVRMLTRNYLQRFLHSPYTRDFMQQFVGAALKLNDRIGNTELARLIGLADPAMQYSLYLQIARGALVNGETDRARFMSEEAKKLADRLKADPTPANFYAAASDVASDAAGTALRQLSRISPDRLHERDRQLLKAAEEVGAVVTRRPKVTSPAKKEISASGLPSMPVADAQTVPVADAQIVPVADALAEPIADALAEPVAAAPMPPSAGWKPAYTLPDNELQKAMGEARRKLAEIDALLGKTIQ